jgi:hypothetical protein
MGFIKGLSAKGIPSRIDKSLLDNMSGSNQSALLAALKWFKLIDDVGGHGAQLEALVKAGDDAGPVLRELLPQAYKFMSDGSIDLSRATGAQLEEKFRAYGVSGETIVKAMSFFIAACREAGVQISTHVKLPKLQRSNGSSKAKKQTKAVAAELELEEGVDDQAELQDVERFEIPIPGKASVKVMVPADLDADDWEMLQSMISVYIKRWKGFKNKGDAG